MKLIVNRIFMGLLLVFVGACDFGPKSAMGFRLPDGDSAKGQQTFVSLECIVCHTVQDLELPPPSQVGPVSVILGGSVVRVKNYGDLVTSIINPSHRLIKDYPEEEVSKDGESLMQNYNDVMTVQQLIDLVAFLQGHYEVVPPEYQYSPYNIY